MTNSSSTFLGIVVGALIGAIGSWWVFNRQKKTSDKQDYTLNRIEQLESYNEKMLEKTKDLEEHNEKMLEKILYLNKKIDSLLEDKRIRRNVVLNIIIRKFTTCIFRNWLLIMS